jgi:hypothetical protein
MIGLRFSFKNEIQIREKNIENMFINVKLGKKKRKDTNPNRHLSMSLFLKNGLSSNLELSK